PQGDRGGSVPLRRRLGHAARAECGRRRPRRRALRGDRAVRGLAGLGVRAGCCVRALRRTLMRTAVTGEVQLHTVLLEVGAGDAPGSGARAQMRGAAVPIDPVRSKTFTSSMWSGAAPASLAATHPGRVVTPWCSRSPDGLDKALRGRASAKERESGGGG